MTVNIVVPDLGDSVVEATILEWHVKEGEAVRAGDPVVELETDKVSVEVPAEKDGVLVSINMQAGDDVSVGDVLGVLDPEAEAGTSAPAPQQSAEDAAPPQAAPNNGAQTQQRAQTAAQGQQISPVASRLASAENVNLSEVQGTGPRGRVTKTDVQQHIATRDSTPAPAAASPTLPGDLPAALAAVASGSGEREERIRMSRRRQTIAKRLLEAKQGTAMLTTFNEMDMSAVIAMRNRYKADFQEKHGVKLGFSSFFVKAVIGALKAFPRLNAEIDGTDMVLKHYYDIGMAIGAEEGLVVPVIRDADRMTFAEIEAQIRDYAQQVSEGTISLAALRGGTFTITNGGVFGSLMSTPILNPPQVGILGLHGIKERPVAVDGDVVIRPMMYTALSYDHRIVDGREAVQFLVRIKELIENPEQLLLEA